MCLYPRLIRNPKYTPNKKNGGRVPKASDPRLLTVAIGCGKCIECRKQKANSWRIRLTEELKQNKEAYFITLTFNEESLNKLWEKDENTTATKAVRLFLERWRKKYKKSVRHWFITERGHEGTERIHLHGLIFTDREKIRELANIWQYGYIYIGEYVNEKTINYLVKYVTKIDNDHKDFEGKILCSAGLGSNYIKINVDKETGEITKDGEGKRFNQYNNNTKEYYRTKEGYKLGLPIYYRNKIYTEKEREKLWLERLDNKKRYITGTKYDFITNNDKTTFLNALLQAQKDNIKNGYGSINWDIEKYCKHELIDYKTLKKLNKS